MTLSYCPIFELRLLLGCLKKSLLRLPFSVHLTSPRILTSISSPWLFVVTLILVHPSCQPVLLTLANNHSLYINIKGSAMATCFLKGLLYRLVNHSSWCWDQASGRGLIFKISKWFPQITVFVPSKNISLLSSFYFPSANNIYLVKQICTSTPVFTLVFILISPLTTDCESWMFVAVLGVARRKPY